MPKGKDIYVSGFGDSGFIDDKTNKGRRHKKMHKLGTLPLSKITGGERGQAKFNVLTAIA